MGTFVFYVDGLNVLKTDGVDVFAVGAIEQVQTIRINNESVVDITYLFDLELGEYVEQSREEREEPLPPTPPTATEKIALLEQQLAQKTTQLNNLVVDMANQTTAILEIYDILGGM